MDAFTDLSLAQWMEKRIGSLAGILDMSAAAGDFDDYVTDVKLSLDEEDLSAFSTLAQIKEVTAYAAVSLWRGIADALSGHYTFSADGGSYSLGDLQDKASASLERAMNDVMKYDASWQVGTAEVTYHNDFYEGHDDDLYT